MTGRIVGVARRMRIQIRTPFFPRRESGRNLPRRRGALFGAAMG